MQNPKLFFLNGPPPASKRQNFPNSGVYQAIDSFLVPKYKGISSKIQWRRLKVDWRSFTRFIQHCVQNLYKGKLQLLIKWKWKLAIYCFYIFSLPHPFSWPSLNTNNFPIRYCLWIWRWKSLNQLKTFSNGFLAKSLTFWRQK